MKAVKANFQIMLCFYLCMISLSCSSESLNNSSKKNQIFNQSEESPAESTRSDPIPRVETSGKDFHAETQELGEEASIATDVTGAYLNIPEGVKARSKPIELKSKDLVPDTIIETWKMFLPIKDELEETTVILYQVISDRGERFFGLIPQSKLERSADAIAFQPKGLGIYQAAVLPELITEERRIRVQGIANGSKLRLLSRHDTSGNAQDAVLYQEDTLFIADGTGIEVFNLNDDGQFNFERRIPSAVNIRQFALAADNRLYFASHDGGIGVMDLEQEGAPVFSNSRGLANGVALAENLNNAYLSQTQGEGENIQPGIARFDIQGNTPNFETTRTLGDDVSTQNAYAIAIQGTTAFVSNRLSFQTYDITQNDRIDLLSTLPSSGQIENFALQDSKAFLAEKGVGVTVVDISVTSNLQRLASLSLPEVLDVAVINNYLIAITANKRAFLLDIADHENMQILHEWPLPSAASKIRIFANQVFILQGDLGFSVFTIEPASTAGLHGNRQKVTRIE
ncbi:MAG: hypothetical protein ACOH5I_06675 [Oligoflexus sp.]